MPEHLESRRSRPGLFFKHVIRKIFLEDWFLKAVALVVTMAIWFGVSLSNKKGTATLTAQLTFRVSDNAVVTNSGVQDLTIRVAGDDRKIDQLYGTDMRVTIDLTGEEPGERVTKPHQGGSVRANARPAEWRNSHGSMLAAGDAVPSSAQPSPPETGQCGAAQ